MKHAVLLAGLALPFLAVAATPEPAPVVRETVTAIAAKVDPDALRATITRLVAFGTRHTLSDTVSETRGIGAARRWAKGRFEAVGADCHGCLTIETPEQTFTGERIKTPSVVQDVIAIQRGTTDPQRVVIISGHLDSRRTDPMDAVGDAPGANDDGSGTSAVLEAARVLSQYKFPATIVYAVLSGEEQGLYGGKILAAFAKTNGWRVEAALNNDIVGNTHGSDGRMVDSYVRVFSEGVRADETPAQAAARRRNGGEVDSPSRELARFIQTLAPYAGQGFGARMILRADRFSRGGDQLPMQEAGYPAVRLTEADENYTRQHQDVRVEGGVNYGDVLSGVDFAYLAKVARLNIVTLAALASAPPPPTGVKIAGAVSPDTTLSWTPSPGASGYRVWLRETTAPTWAQSRDAGDASTLTLKGVNIDDFTFGVSARGPDGWESPVEFPGSAGAFFKVR
jgi:acetylornithine deacetylase/succinyl-diaminopimelate desuccinylase-like protein